MITDIHGEFIFTEWSIICWQTVQQDITASATHFMISGHRAKWNLVCGCWVAIAAICFIWVGTRQWATWTSADNTSDRFIQTNRRSITANRVFDQMFCVAEIGIYSLTFLRFSTHTNRNWTMNSKGRSN